MPQLIISPVMRRLCRHRSQCPECARYKFCFGPSTINKKTLQNHFQSVWSCWTQGNPSCKCCRPLDLKNKEQNEEKEICRQRYTAQKQTQEISNIPWEHTPYIQEPWQMKRLPVINIHKLSGMVLGYVRKYAGTILDRIAGQG